MPAKTAWTSTRLPGMVKLYLPPSRRVSLTSRPWLSVTVRAART